MKALFVFKVITRSRVKSLRAILTSHETHRQQWKEKVAVVTPMTAVELFLPLSFQSMDARQFGFHAMKRWF